MHRQIFARSYPILFLLAICLLQLAGCQLIDDYIPGYTNRTITATQTQNDLEQKHRKRYQIDRDPESIRWLKANRLKQGMTLGDVNQVLGVNGVPVLNQRKFIGKSNLYRSSDVTYKWGPDADGNSHFLVFRDDKLVNYDPEEFQED